MTQRAELTTLVKKGPYGWTAVTEIDLHEVPSGTRVLEIYTMKRFNVRISTMATSWVREPSQNGFSVKTHTLFGDFSAKVLSNPEKVRVTEKVVTDFHAEALKGVDAVVEAAKDFYREETA